MPPASASNVHPGPPAARPMPPRFGSDGFSVELARYLRERLRLAVRVLWLVASVVLLLNLAARLEDQGWRPALLVDPELLVLTGALVVATVVYRWLARPDLSAQRLATIDAVLLLMLAMVCVCDYHFDFRRGGGHGVPFFSLLLVARAVVVPSTARRTFWLSTPALPAVFLVQLGHGVAGDPLPSGLSDAAVAPFGWPWWATVVWTQCLLGFALGIATMASRVTFRLRVSAYEAQRLGPYELKQQIGSGGMGDVYCARHALMRRPVAIKFVKPSLGGEGLLERFEEEVRTTSRLTHPNSIMIYDYGTTPEGLFYYVMELLDGADLDHIVAGTGPMPAARVIHVLCQALDALAEAHALGFIHRDIKPANLVLCTRGLEHDVLKVMDFGLVKDLGRRAPSPSVLGEVVGSPSTMAPETLRGLPPTPCTDLYSLAVVGCFLLTGTLPFEGRTAVELVLAHLQQPPRRPSASRPDVPADLEAVLLLAMEKDPDARPSSALEMRRMLGGCADAGRWSASDASAWWARNGGPFRVVADPDSSGPAVPGARDVEAASARGPDPSSA